MKGTTQIKLVIVYPFVTKSLQSFCYIAVDYNIEVAKVPILLNVILLCQGYNLAGCCRASDGMVMSSKNPSETNKQKQKEQLIHQLLLKLLHKADSQDMHEIEILLNL